MSFTEGQALTANDLPPGWRATADLNLDLQWEYAEVEAYLYDEPTRSEWITRDDVDPNEWALTPGPSLLFPGPSCEDPLDAGTPVIETATVWSDASTAAVETYAMDKATFWSIIEATRALATTPDKSTALTSQLQDLSADQLRAFQGRLVLEIMALDTAANWNQSELLRQLFGRGSTSSADYFTAYRCGLMLQGEAAAASAETFGFGLSDIDIVVAASILNSAWAAAAQSGAVWDDSREPTIPPMGSNTDGW